MNIQTNVNTVLKVYKQQNDFNVLTYIKINKYTNKNANNIRKNSK